jgi:hypothetical protein
MGHMYDKDNFFPTVKLCPCTIRPLKDFITGTPEEIERLERTVEDYKSALAQQQVRLVVFYCIHIYTHNLKSKKKCISIDKILKEMSK